MTESHLEDIAEAIRGKNGTQTEYKPGQMAAAIRAIDTGGIVPTGTIAIVENGTVNVEQYASANVNVQPTLQSKSVTPGASQQTIQSDSGYDGLSSVTINGDADLVAGNIKKGVEIFGVTGSYDGEGDVALSNYIESNTGTYINTGYIPKSNSQFEIVAKYESSDLLSYYTAFFGAQDLNSPYNATQISPKWGPSSNYRVAFGSSSASVSWESLAGLKSEYAIKQGIAYAKQFGVIDIDGKIPVSAYLTINFSNTQSFSQHPIYLFGINHGGAITGRIKFRCYRFRIWEAETLIMNLLPWVDDNDVVCMKDTVSGNLFYNAGTDSLSYGTDG